MFAVGNLEREVERNYLSRNKNNAQNSPNVFKGNEIYDRGKEGFEVYAKGMDASMCKAMFLPFVKKGLILEIGCDNCTELDLLSNSNVILVGEKI